MCQAPLAQPGAGAYFPLCYHATETYATASSPPRPLLALYQPPSK